MLAVSLRLFHLPCGCVTEVLYPEMGFAVCPWCETVFDEGELRKWVAAMPVPFVQMPRPLATDGKRLLEVLGVENGWLMVRERARGAKPEVCNFQITQLMN